jgi:integrase
VPTSVAEDKLAIGVYRHVQQTLQPAAKAAGIVGLKPHELRHTCASLAIAAGANVKVLQTLLGHKTATLTLDRYGHLFPDDLGRIADAFDVAAESAAGRLRDAGLLRAVPSQAGPI